MRCTDRSPVSPRHTSSVVSGSSGAATRQTVSSTVKSVGSPVSGRSTSPTGRRPTTCPRTTSWSPRWTRCATSAPPGSALRKGAALRNRLPLSSLTVVVAGAERLTGFEEIVADELNVKDVRLLDADHPDAASYDVSQRLTVNARAAGPRLGKDVQTAIRASKAGDWSVSESGEVTAGGLVLAEGEFSLETVAGGGDDAATGMLPGGGFVVLDTRVTPELEAEGVARDLVRAVQQARRDAGLDVSDRITLDISAVASVADAARTHAALIRRETLATTLEVHEADVESPVIELSRA